MLCMKHFFNFNFNCKIMAVMRKREIAAAALYILCFRSLSDHLKSFKRHRADVKWESVLFSFRLNVLATPDAVVSHPVAQLSIPINGKFELIRGM